MYLDATTVDEGELTSHFSTIYSTCLERGIDIRNQLIPIVPAAHYLCGGVLTDTNALTSLSRLYAFGEVACTGVHGANRLASNSLLEAVVFSERALNHILTQFQKSFIHGSGISVPDGSIDTTADIQQLRQKVKAIMWRHCGIVRSRHGLQKGLELIAPISESAAFLQSGKNVEAIELRNIVQVAILILQSALRRTESCGAHFMENEILFQQNAESIESIAI
jgi:L-aspartate oxidase